MIVLLNDACTWAIASSTFLRAFFGFFAAAAAAAVAGAAAAAAAAGGDGAFCSAISFLFAKDLPVSSPASDLARRGVELHCLLTRPLAGAGVGARALTADRQALAVAHAPPSAQIHQPLDIH